MSNCIDIYSWFSDELNLLGVVGMWGRGESGLTAYVSGLGSYIMGYA